MKKDKMERRRRLKRAVLIVALVVLAGVGTKFAVRESKKEVTVPKSPNEPIRMVKHPGISFLLPLSGPFAKDGEMLKLGAELAWSDVQKIKGDLGELKIYDGTKKNLAIESLLSSIVNDKETIAVVTHLPEKEISAIIPTLEKHRLPLVVPGVSHENLYYHAWVFPLVPSDRSEGAFAARVIHEWGGRREVGVIRCNGVYGDLLENGFEGVAGKLPFSYKRYRVPEDGSGTGDTVERIIKDKIVALWLAGPPVWGKRLIGELLRRGYQGKILVPRSFSVVQPEDLLGKTLNRLYLVRSVVRFGGDEERSDLLRSFIKRFQMRYWRDPDWLAILGYDAVRWLGECMVKGAGDGITLRRCLLQYDSPERAYKGCAGPFYFGSDGRVCHPLQVAVYRRGRFVRYQGG